VRFFSTEYVFFFFGFLLSSVEFFKCVALRSVCIFLSSLNFKYAIEEFLFLFFSLMVVLFNIVEEILFLLMRFFNVFSQFFKELCILSNLSFLMMLGIFENALFFFHFMVAIFFKLFNELYFSMFFFSA